MIETQIRSYLANKLGVGVFFEKTEDNTADNYLIIERTSGERKNFINTAEFAIQSYSTSMYGAADLNEGVKDAMESMPADVTNVSAVTLNGDYNYTDTTKKLYRYQSLFEVVYMD